MLQRRPVFCFSAVFILTALIINYLPPAALLPLAAIFVIGTVLCVRLRRGRLLCAAALLALLCNLLFTACVLGPVQRLGGRTAMLSVTVDRENTSYRDGMSCGTLRVRAVDGQKANFCVYCSAFPQGEVGECFEAQFELSLPESDGYLYSNYADGIFLGADYVGDYTPLEQNESLRYRLMRLQAFFSKQLRSVFSERLGAVASAMVVGDKTHLTEEIRADYRRAGLSHLLVVSGLHLAILCGLVWNRAESARKFSKIHAVLCMGSAVFFMLLTGLTPSVCRAGIAVLIFYGGILLLRPADSLTSLALAGLIIAVPNAYAVCDMGFQLSFTATLGVLLAARLEEAEQNALEIDALWKYLLFRLGAAAQLAACASAVTLPVLLLQGLPVSGVTVLSNLAVLWLVSPILVTGVGTVLLGCIPILRPLYYGCGLLLGLLLRLLEAMVVRLAALPFATLYLPREYSLFVYGIIVLVGIVAYRSRKPLFFVCTSAACVLVAWSAGLALGKNTVTLTLVGTRNNPCVVVHQNETTAVLFRGGASNRNDVEDYLEMYGQTQPDFLLDLRNDPSEIVLRAGQLVSAKDLDGTQTFELTPDICIQASRDTEGTLALILVRDYSIAVTAGQPQSASALPVDAWVAGTARPKALAPQRVLTAADGYSWMEEEQNTEIWLESGTLQLMLRPGRSAKIKGGIRYALRGTETETGS